MENPFTFGLFFFKFKHLTFNLIWQVGRQRTIRPCCLCLCISCLKIKIKKKVFHNWCCTSLALLGHLVIMTLQCDILIAISWLWSPCTGCIKNKFSSPAQQVKCCRKLSPFDYDCMNVWSMYMWRLLNWDNGSSVVVIHLCSLHYLHTLQ